MTTMAKISRVLVGVDFDDASASALDMAGALAVATGAGITLFHSATHEVPPYFTASQIEALEAERAQSRAATAGRLRAFAGERVPGAFDINVGEGPPEQAIVRMAPSFDLVVVATHRRHGPQRWWLGSVAEAVVRQSARPVLVVPAGAAVPDLRGLPTILAAGGDDAGAAAWADLFRIAFGGTVVQSPDICHCGPERLQNADLIVLPVPADGGTHSFSAIVEVLKECLRPVLFVPPADGTSERRSS